MRKDAQRINVPIAYVSLKKIQTVHPSGDAQDIIDQLNALAKRELPEHMRPVEIRIVDKMPMTVSKKIDYRTLEEEANG